MEKLITNDSSDYFIKVIQPKLNRLKEQDPFDDYQYKTLRYYDQNVWEAMNIPVKNTDESIRVARSRAFSLAKKKIFFNPDLRYFITLTYKKNMQDYEALMHDVKMFLKSEKRLGKNPKYIWVVERQKRGALHVHMICNDFFTVEKNKYNKLTIPTWRSGFSSVDEIKINDSHDTDINFKPYLYLFKYMNKSEKIGGRYVHSSRNLNNFDELTDFNFDKSSKLRLFTEISQMGTIDTFITRSYYTNIN